MRRWAHTESQRGERLLPLAHLHMLSWGMRPLLAIPTTRTRASLTSQQPLGDAEGMHQVLRKVQVGRVLTKLGEALGQGCAPQPVLPRTQGHIQQTAWRDREGVRGDGWLRGTPPCGAHEHPSSNRCWDTQTQSQTAPQPLCGDGAGRGKGWLAFTIETQTKNGALNTQCSEEGKNPYTSPSRTLEVWGHSGCNVWTDSIG